MKILKDDVFIYPTDTVWGIGSSVYSKMGYDKIAEIKKTSKDKPLSIMFSSVDEILTHFNLPVEFNKLWLSDFFKLETTLGLPLTWCKLSIPSWATGESSFISLRCLESAVIKKIDQEIKSPFFSTSLNLTGEPPIVSYSDAVLFQKTHAPEAHFVNSDSEDNLSGSSSTVVFFTKNKDEKLKYEIKREGKRSKEVKEHLAKLV